MIENEKPLGVAVYPVTIHVSEEQTSSDVIEVLNFNKYYDKFTTTTPFTTKNKQTIGQSLYEVAGWYRDQEYTFSSSSHIIPSLIIFLRLYLLNGNKTLNEIQATQ